MNTINVRNIVKRFAIVTILAGVSPLALGCAAQTDGVEPTPAENVAATEQALVGFGPSDILLEMAKGALGSAGGHAFSALFPEDKLDVQKLLADIDAQTRQAIMDEALRHDKAAIDAALTKLKDIEAQQAVIGQPQTKTAEQLYAEVIASSTLAGIDPVISGLGPNASDKFKRDGINLYVAAKQIEVSQAALRMGLMPSLKGSDIVVALRILDEGVAHVNKTVKDARQQAFDTRLGQVTTCYQWWVDTDSRYEYYTRYEDKSSGAIWGQSSSYDQATAFGRCDIDRDGHYGRVHVALAKQLDDKYGFALTMAEAWKKTANDLRKLAEGKDVVTGLDFGGMYGFGYDAAHPQSAKVFTNPFTGNASCPAGYDAVKFAGRINVDYDAFQCVRKTNGTTQSVADFGGMYGQLDYREANPRANNPLTGGWSCPAGFTSYQVLGGSNVDADLFWCGRPHTAGSASTSDKFGGAFNRDNGNANPLSEGASCSNGFVPTQVWGSSGTHGRHVDQMVTLCWKP